MRALLLLFVTFSLVPFALSSRMLPSSSDAVVVDVKGNELKLGKPYYALSSASMQPEGLCLENVKSKNETSADCPHNVVQCTIFYESILGLPITFSSGGNATTTQDDDGAAVVKEDIPYTIQFPATGSCAKDNVWGLVYESDTTCKFVTTDPTTPPVEFKIQKEESGYKLVYCETIPLPRISICFPVGLVQVGLYYSRLVVGVDVQPVQFFFVRSNATAVQNHAYF